MSGLGAFALGAAPLAGGLLVGGMAGRGGPNAPDLRALIKSEMDLLERIPEDQVTRRAALEQVIAQHIDALVVAIEKGRQLQRRTSYLTENWRDLVLFLTTVLFAVVAWHADHNRPLWLPIFIAATLLSVVTALYVLRGLLRHLRTEEIPPDVEDLPSPMSGAAKRDSPERAAIAPSENVSDEINPSWPPPTPKSPPD
ncbi:MAG: hypothetical protein ABWZ98_16290 [Nakamurella sp.]